MLSAKISRRVLYNSATFHRVITGVQVEHLKPTSSINKFKNIVFQRLNESNLLTIAKEPYSPFKHPHSILRLYNSAAHQALRPSFYQALGLDNTFTLQMRLLVLHLWIIKRALDSKQTETRFGRRFVKNTSKDLWKNLWIHQRRAIKLADVAMKDTQTFRKVLYKESIEFAFALDEAFNEAEQSTISKALQNETPLFKCLHK
jgi:hypothetical protein